MPTARALQWVRIRGRSQGHSLLLRHQIYQCVQPGFKADTRIDIFHKGRRCDRTSL